MRLALVTVAASRLLLLFLMIVLHVLHLLLVSGPCMRWCSGRRTLQSVWRMRGSSLRMQSWIQCCNLKPPTFLAASLARRIASSTGRCESMLRRGCASSELAPRAGLHAAKTRP